MVSMVGKIRRVLLMAALLCATASAYSASKTLLVLGDSLSAEYGLARGSGWVALLEKRLKAENLDVRVVNASISGDTTSGGRTRLPALLEKHKPDVMVLELGANDALRGLPVPSTGAIANSASPAAASNSPTPIGARMPKRSTSFADSPSENAAMIRFAGRNASPTSIGSYPSTS